LAKRFRTLTVRRIKYLEFDCREDATNVLFDKRSEILEKGKIKHIILLGAEPQRDYTSIREDGKIWACVVLKNYYVKFRRDLTYDMLWCLLVEKGIVDPNNFDIEKFGRWLLEEREKSDAYFLDRLLFGDGKNASS